MKKEIACTIVFLMLTSCSSFVQDLSRSSAKGATEGVYEGAGNLDDPLIKKIKSELLKDGFLQQTSTEVALAATTGIREGLSDVDFNQKIDSLAISIDKGIRTRGYPALVSLLEKLEPHLARLVKVTVVETIESGGASFKTIIKEDLPLAAETIAAAAIEGIFNALAAELNGPVAAKTENIISTRFPKFAGKVSYTMAREAITGIKDGIKDEFPNTLLNLRKGVDRVQVALVTGVIVLGVLLFLALVGVSMISRSYRSSSKALAIIAGRINEKGTPELKRAIQEGASRSEVQGWLSDFLTKRGL